MTIKFSNINLLLDREHQILIEALFYKKNHEWMKNKNDKDKPKILSSACAIFDEISISFREGRGLSP